MIILTKFVLLLGVLTKICIADELFVLLTQENGIYRLHYNKNDKSPWVSLSVPTAIQRVEDVEFNYYTNFFYFSSTQPLKKGFWKANMNLTNPVLTQQLRDDSSPMKFKIYPEYDLAIFYDQGYSLIIELTLLNEVNDLRIKSLYTSAERLDGTFFVDKKSNQVYAQADDGRGILLNSALDGLLLTAYPFAARAQKNATVSAFDEDNQIIYYCANGYMNAMTLKGSTVYPVTTRLPCARMAADNGLVYHIDTANNFIQKVNFSASGVVINDNRYLQLPFTITPTINILSFKHYSYNPQQTAPRYCNTMDCDQICLPKSQNNEAVCTCMDYYTLGKYNTPGDSSPCVKETLHGPSVFYAVYNISFATDSTLFYRLYGDPNGWISRPQREQLFTISSDVAAIAFDWQNQRIIAAALRYRQIMSAKLDGTFATAGHYSGLSLGVKSIAYDWVGNNVYWYDPTFRWLRIVSLSKSQQSAQSGAYKTSRIGANIVGYALKLDAVAGYLFFLELDDSASRVALLRTLMDGSEVKTIYTFPADVFSDSLDDNNPETPLPGAINIDFAKRQVWVAFTGNMFVLTYDGQLVYTSKIGTADMNIYNSRVSSLALFSSSYAMVVVTRTDTALSTLFVYSIIRKADGSCCNSLINSYNKTLYGDYRGITNYEEQPPPPATLNCTALNCSHLCTNIRGKPTCICWDNYAWDDGSKTCKSNPFNPSFAPAVAFAAADKICYRLFNDQTSWIGATAYANYDNCTAIGFVGGPIDSPRSIDVDPVTFRAYVLQQLTNPRSIFRIGMETAMKNAYSFNFLSALGQIAASMNPNSTASANEVFYSGVVGNSSIPAAVAFDWLARNLYISDQATGRFQVVSEHFTNPLILTEGLNCSAIAVDPIRRKLYLALVQGSGGTKLVQRDLDATNECVIAILPSDTVIDIEISHYTLTLVALLQPSNSVARFLLKRFPPYVSCPSASPTIQYTKMARSNVTRIAFYRSVMLFTCSADICSQKIFASTNLGLTVDTEQTVFQSGRAVSLSGLAVFDPQLLSLASNQTGFVANDSCAAMNRGLCEQFCLSSWPSIGARTTPQCKCSDGMAVLKDNRTCAPRYMDILKSGAIFTPDDYRHEVFSVPLTVLDSINANTSYIKDVLTTFTVHSRARPYAVAYDPVGDYIYYSDFERAAIYRISPGKQMSQNLVSTNPVNELFIKFAPQTRVYGLFIDQISRVLFYTVRDNRTLFAADLETNQIATVKVFNGNIFGVVMDRRVDKMHLYVSLRNTTTLTSITNFTNAAFQGRVVLSFRSNPFTWSAVARCSMDGSNCITLVNFTATGQDVQTVPWIYDMSVDYSANKLYFATGQNRSIMSINIGDANPTPQVFMQAPDTSSFVYGIQVLGNYVLTTDWGRGGIHVYEKTLGRQLITIGPQYLIGVNGLALYSRQVDNDIQANSACKENRVCSHVCVPLPNNQRKCICPNGDDTVDGINCPGANSCPKPSATTGTLDSKCLMRTDNICTLTCSNSLTVDASVRGSSFPVSCSMVNGSANWCADLSALCLASGATPNPSAINRCIATADAIRQAASASTSGSGLHPGIIAAIVIGCLIIVAGLLAVGYFMWRRLRNPEISHERFDTPVGSVAPSGAGLPHHDELGVPDSFRYRHLAESDINPVST